MKTNDKNNKNIISSRNPNTKNSRIQKLSDLSLGESIFSGTRWTSVSQGGSQIIRFGVSIVLARLLAPQDFGLMAMAMVVTGFMEIFKDLGTVAAIVQKKEFSSELLSSLFYFNIIFGLITGGLIAVGAKAAAWMYGDPRLNTVLQVLSLTFVISSCGLVNKALLQRNMQFDKLAIVELSAVVIHGVMAITLGILGWGVWSLVGGAVAASLTSTVLLWITLTWRPKLHFKWFDVRTVFDFSLNLSGAKVVNYFMFNIDRIIIGRFLGATTLGFYELAQRIFMTPAKTITQVLTRVLFPGLAQIQDDNEQIKEKYLRACGAIALISFPLLGGLWIVARPFVLSVFGTKWIPMIPLILILTPVGIIQSIASTVGVIYLVKGRTDWLLRWEIFAGFCLTLGFIFGLHWGIIGIATGYLIAMIILSYPGFAIPFRLIDLRFLKLVSELKPYVLATLTMLALVFVLRIILEHFNFMPRLVLIFSVVFGAITYGTVIILNRPQALADFQKMFFIEELLRKGT